MSKISFDKDLLRYHSIKHFQRLTFRNDSHIDLNDNIKLFYGGIFIINYPL